MDNLLVDLTNQFHTAGHTNSFAAGRAYLADLIKDRTPDKLPVKKRQRLL